MSETVPYIQLKSQFIEENQQQLINDLTVTHANLQTKLTKDSTWDYGLYNVFGASSPSPYMYRVYEELRWVVRQQIPEGAVWIQSWLNFHKENQALDWHTHTFPLHGYICIDPKNSTTEFEEWSIDNEVGTVYIGPGNVKHRVLVNDTYTGNRITIGFDVITESSLAGDFIPSMNFGAFPLL